MLKVDSYAKLRNAFWIPYICFDPNIDEFFEKEHVKLYWNNPSDQLLKSVFDFLDVNDASAVNKILDDAA